MANWDKFVDALSWIGAVASVAGVAYAPAAAASYALNGEAAVYNCRIAAGRRGEQCAESIISLTIPVAGGVGSKVVTRLAGTAAGEAFIDALRGIGFANDGRGLFSPLVSEPQPTRK